MAAFDSTPVYVGDDNNGEELTANHMRSFRVQSAAFASRPAAGNQNVHFISTNGKAADGLGPFLYRDDGTAWQDVGRIGFTVRTAIKTADETVNNSTTLQNDDHLVLAVNASTKYTLVAFLIGFADNDTPDIKIKWILPTGGTMRWAELRELGAGTQALTELTEVSEAALPTTNANKIFLFTGAVTIAGTAGNVQLQWAQNILTAVNVKLLTSSFFTLTEI